MWRHNHTAAIGVVLSIVGLALSALMSFYLADRVVFSWRTGLPLQFVQEPTWIAAFTLLGLIVGLTGAFLVWLGIRELRACREKTGSVPGGSA